jgi:hypothetical protein
VCASTGYPLPSLVPPYVQLGPVTGCILPYHAMNQCRRLTQHYSSSSYISRASHIAQPQAVSLPVGYVFYPFHRDQALPFTMARIIESMHQPPSLPRCSIFDYLFEPKGESYPTPDPENTAFIDGFTGRQIKRGEVGMHARQLATGILALGTKPGDVMCLFGMNSYEWINALLGGQAAGLVVSPASYG